MIDALLTIFLAFIFGILVGAVLLITSQEGNTVKPMNDCVSAIEVKHEMYYSANGKIFDKLYQAAKECENDQDN